MKKHTYSDKSKSFHYEVGDQIRFSRTYENYGICYTRICPKNTKGRVVGIREYHPASTKSERFSSIIGLVNIRLEHKHKETKANTNWTENVFNVPVWYIAPRNNKIAAQAEEIKL